MNTTTRKARSLTAALITFGSLVGGADAALVISWKQSGGDVVGMSTGSLEAPLTYISNNTAFTPSSYLYSGGGYIGQPSMMFTDSWNGTYSGSFDANFSSSNAILDSGVYVGLGSAVGGAIVNSDYTYGDSLNSSSTWTSTNLDTLGLALDDNWTMTYNTATGTDSITLRVVPEPSSAILLGLGSLSLILRRRCR